MPLEALLIPVNPTNSDYDGINGGTGCNFIFLYINYLTEEGSEISRIQRFVSSLLHLKYQTQIG